MFPGVLFTYKLTSEGFVSISYQIICLPKSLLLVNTIKNQPDLS